MQDSKSPTIAPSSAAEVDMTVEEAERNLDVIKEKRAAIFDDTKDKLLKMEQKSVFRYRQARLSIWRGREDTMIDVQEWNDRYDRKQLEKLQKEEEQLEMLLEAALVKLIQMEQSEMVLEAALEKLIKTEQ
jgi:hypothetical protein